MNVLLETCALLGLARGELPQAAAAALRTAPEAWACAVCPWEIAIMAASGRLRLSQPPLDWFQALAIRHRLREVPIDARLATAAAALPHIHRDPFDRVLVALAQEHSLNLLTSDRTIAQCPDLKTLW